MLRTQRPSETPTVPGEFGCRYPRNPLKVPDQVHEWTRPILQHCCYHSVPAFKTTGTYCSKRVAELQSSRQVETTAPTPLQAQSLAGTNFDILPQFRINPSQTRSRSSATKPFSKTQIGEIGLLCRVVAAWASQRTRLPQRLMQAARPTFTIQIVSATNSTCCLGWSRPDGGLCKHEFIRIRRPAGTQPLGQCHSISTCGPARASPTHHLKFQPPYLTRVNLATSAIIGASCG
jgi:hypothetical protein